jgi:hypothetical protein
MAAGLGFKTFATGDVLTAGDTNGYLMQGVWVFASAAARTSAVTSPQEGNISYLKDTDVTQYYSGSAWVTIGGSSGALTLITTGTAANTSPSLSINNCFSSTYTNYLLLVDLTTTASADLAIRLRVSGTDNTANYYENGFSQVSTSATVTGFANAAATVYSLGDIDTARKSYVLNISNPFVTTQTTFIGTGVRAFNGTNSQSYFSNGAHNSATSFDGLTFRTGASNLTGTVKVYGYSN